MRFLHTMVRVRDLGESLEFYCGKLGLVELRRVESEKGRFTLVYLCTREDEPAAKAALAAGRYDAPMVELTWNWDAEDYGSARNFGHLAFEVDDIHAICAALMAAGVTINRPPRDGHMAFIRSPDLVSIELLQRKDSPLEPCEPWLSMPNTGVW